MDLEGRYRWTWEAITDGPRRPLPMDLGDHKRWTQIITDRYRWTWETITDEARTLTE